MKKNNANSNEQTFFDEKINVLKFSSSPAISAGNVRIENGVPIYRYRKEVIKCGQYFKEADNIAFEVTQQTLDHWVATFAAFIAAGNKVPIPLTHYSGDNPGNNAGWIIDLYREENSLIAILDLVGEDGPKLALTFDVSLCSPPSVIDGKGNKYIRPITHIALTTEPVIPGLKGFEVIAASMKSFNNPNTENSKMENLKKIAASLGMKIEELGEDATKAGEAIMLSVKAKLDELAVATTKVADLTKTNETLALSAKGRDIDPMLITLAKDNRTIKLGALVSAAKITPAVKDKLLSVFATDESLKLSLGKGVDNFDKVVAALAENDPVKLGEQSGKQAIILSQNRSDEQENVLLKDAENRANKK